MLLRRLLVVGAVALCYAPPARAQIYFANPVDLSADNLWTNYLRVVDLSGDGHLDIVVSNASGFFTTPGPQPFQVYVNDGKGAFSEATAAVLGAAFDKSVRQFAVGDVDGDGLPDLYVPDANGQGADRLYMNKGGGSFADEAVTRLPKLSSSSGATRFGDFDGDGDLDLIVLNGYVKAAPDFGKLYLNDGSGKFSESPNAMPAISGGVDPDDVDVADFDRDFDLDILVNPHQGDVLLWLNDGAAKFTAKPLPKLGGGFHYGPTACDVDGDGDLDIWVDNVAPSYGEALLINDGNANFSHETAARVTDNDTGADDNGVACVDIDGDGDFDAAIMSLSEPERFLINDGTGHFVKKGGFPSVVDPTLWFDFGDLDGDGRLDVVTGQGEGPNRINKVYLASSQGFVDTRPPLIIASKVTAAGSDQVVQFAVSDAVVTDGGAQLSRAFLRITSPSPSEVDAVFSGGDLYRAVLPNVSGELTFAACAVDRRKNEGCGDPQTVGGSGGTGGSAGGGGSAGTAGSSGSAGAGAGGAAGAGVGGQPAGGAPGSGATNGAGPSNGGDDGCGCRVGRQAPPSSSLLLVALGALLFWRRRR